MSHPSADCSDEFNFVIQSFESESLNSDQITDIFKFDSSSNTIKIHTDDFETYADKEATIQLKVVSEKS